MAENEERNDVIDIAGRRNDLEECWSEAKFDELNQFFCNDTAFGPKDTSTFSENVEISKAVQKLGRSGINFFPENITIMKTNEWAMEYGVLSWKEKSPDEKGSLERKGKYTITWTFRENDWRIFLFMDNSTHAGRQYNQSLLGGNRPSKKE